MQLSDSLRLTLMIQIFVWLSFILIMIDRFSYTISRKSSFTLWFLFNSKKRYQNGKLPVDAFIDENTG